jgi:hypothetical protein
MKLRAYAILLLATAGLAATSAGAATIGQNTPAQPITAARIATLPAKDPGRLEAPISPARKRRRKPTAPPWPPS